ncbi:ferritin-like domain-containing protein [Neobacillus notoginsengisoli]|uniref:Ferritin-like domain-containing protein n=1 Tax=Neobacillus notoginsengisoli TaxID=1578198 RepID=A0A417YWS1_9BACI|nr:ferritin-like domain-containing protein [Neobacillus notoginsengisoli]RHW42047.1 ferritin-like domain-containing protein [Neobacillus notoginsengisoli]
MYPYGYPEENYRQQHQLVADLAKAVNGEYSAVQCYEQLARMAPNQSIREQINEIRNDEMRHYREFVRFYTSLTGRRPNVQINEGCPQTYREGLDFAFRDEQETVDFYLDIAERATTQEMRKAFKRASADEQSHAVWFLYFMTAHR